MASNHNASIAPPVRMDHMIFNVLESCESPSVSRWLSVVVVVVVVIVARTSEAELLDPCL